MSNTIVLRASNPGHCHEEAPASATLKPGHLLERVSDGDVRKHSTYGGVAEMLFAKEDYLQGGVVSDSYAADDRVLMHAALPGDVIQARLPAGAAAVTTADRLLSNGDGTLVKAPFAGLTPAYDSVAASAAVTNTTTETAFDKTLVLPANSLKVGDIIRVRAQAIATSTNSTDSLNLKLYVGSVEICATGAVDVANNDIGYIEADVVIRTIGASGTLVGAGVTSLGVPGTVTAKPFLKASATIDTTAANTVQVKATWSVASASNSVRLDVMNITILRAAGQTLIAQAEESVDNSAGVAEAFINVRVL